MPSNRVRSVRVIAVCSVIGALVSAGCGGADESSPGDGGGSLVVGLTYAPTTLNPNYVNDPANYFILENIYSRLVGYGYDAQVHGDLAESWEMSADGLRYTFDLVDDAQWSDGESVTSADVVWTAQSILEEEGYGATALAGVASVEAPDDDTVVLVLDQPNSSFLDQLAQRYGWVILPEHVFAGTDVLTNEANGSPVGSGPFVVTSFTPGEAVELAANDGYFGGRPALDALTFRFFPSADAAVSALQTGEIQFMANAPSYASIDTLRQSAGITVDSVTASPPTDVWLGFNLRREPLSDVRVRQAISMAIDADEINELVYGGTQNATGTVYDPSSKYWQEDIVQPTHDIDAANRLLDDAGYPAGDGGVRFGLTYTGFVASLGGADQIGEVLRQQLAEVGIDLTLENYEFSVFAEKIMQNHEFDITWSGGPHGPDPQVFANYVGTDGNRNAMGYSNPRVDQLFRDARLTDEEAQQEAMYAEIQQLVADELPRFTLFQWQYQFPYASDFTGFWWQDEAGGEISPDDYSGVRRADG